MMNESGPVQALDDAVAVLTVNWNRPALTLACLQSLRQTRGARWHLFIVDNASTDNSIEQLTDLGNDVTLVRSPTNGGWAGGNNLAVRSALNAGYSHLFLLNNDAEVAPDTLAELLRVSNEAAVRPVIGAVQLEGDYEAGSFSGTRKEAGSVFDWFMDADAFAAEPELFDTGFIKGAALFAHRVHFDRIGTFDDRFYLNFKEQDWCERAKAAGFPVLMSKRAIVRHAGSGTMGGYDSPMSCYFLIRNGLLYAEMHGGPKLWLKAVISRLEWANLQYHTKNWAKGLGKAAIDRSSWAVAFRLGLRDYALRRFGDCPPVIRDLTRQHSEVKKQLAAAEAVSAAKAASA